jgi:hypothetical protein
MRLCACGCGEPTSKYYDKTGVWKTYRKYASRSHIPKKIPTREVLNNLALHRQRNWANPEHRAKMSRISSETIKRTNERRAAGEFPEWDRKHSENMKIRTAQMWRDGTLSRAQHQRFGIFRSRLERRFSLLLDLLKIEWKYEPKAFEVTIDGHTVSYTPDFYLPTLDHWIEIKGFWRDKESKEKAEAFIQQNPTLQFSVLHGDRTGPFTTILGNPWNPA